MNYAVETTDQDLIIKIPLSEMGTSTAREEIIKYFEYVALGVKSQNMEKLVGELATESKGRWWAANKERFRDVPGFERFF